MKWLLLLIFLLLVSIFAYLGYVVFAVFTSIDDVNSCNIDSDCIIVSGIDVCKTPVSINKNYEFRWSKKTSYTYWLYELTGTANFKECEKLREATLPSCENNKCVILGQ